MKLITFLLAGAVQLAAADWYARNVVSIGGAAARPRGQIVPGLGDSPAFSFSYAHRFLPNFQVEGGLDSVFGAAGVRDYLDTAFGPLRIRDYQFIVPFGGRAVIPFASRRAELTAGGGGAYFNYREGLRQPSEYFHVECPPCRARGGWGYYGAVGLSAALDRRGVFWFGASAKMYRGHTDGDPLGDLAGVRTRDRWLMLGGEFSVRF
jgi:hypothetical protein